MKYVSKAPDLTVKLVNHTPFLLESLYFSEKFAKTRGGVPDPEQLNSVRLAYKSNSELAGVKLNFAELPDDNIFQGISHKDLVDEIEVWGSKVASAAIPISEQLNFVFSLDMVPISLREQLVRHTLGTTFWIQSGRITDYSNFFSRGEYHNPFEGSGLLVDSKDINDKLLYDALFKSEVGFMESSGKVLASELFDLSILLQEKAFKALKSSGARDEDARDLIGTGATHRLTMGINLRSLIGICKQRSCFILQNLWLPLIKGIISEVRKVEPILATAISKPPCDNGKLPCPFKGMMQDRIIAKNFDKIEDVINAPGEDPLPTCPLSVGVAKRERWWGDSTDRVVNIDRLKKVGRWDEDRNKIYGNLWGSI